MTTGIQSLNQENKTIRDSNPMRFLHALRKKKKKRRKIIYIHADMIELPK